MNTITLSIELTFDKPVEADDCPTILEKVNNTLDQLYDEPLPNLTLVSGIQTVIDTEGTM